MPYLPGATLYTPWTTPAVGRRGISYTLAAQHDRHLLAGNVQPHIDLPEALRTVAEAAVTQPVGAALMPALTEAPQLLGLPAAVQAA